MSLGCVCNRVSNYSQCFHKQEPVPFFIFHSSTFDLKIKHHYTFINAVHRKFEEGKWISLKAFASFVWLRGFSLGLGFKNDVILRMWDVFNQQMPHAEAKRMIYKVPCCTLKQVLWSKWDKSVPFKQGYLRIGDFDCRYLFSNRLNDYFVQINKFVILIKRFLFMIT